MGKNIVTVEATDSKGNTAAKTIQIERRTSSQIQLSERLSLAVLPFDHDGAAANLVPGFHDSLVHALAGRNRFQLIERHHIDLILQEQGLTRTKLFDPDTASKLGRLVSARTVLTGTLAIVQNRVLVAARMVDVETSKIISRQDIWGQLNDPLFIKNMAEGLALKFHQDFPLVDGRIIEKQGQNIVVDLGQTSLRPGRRLILFRQDPLVHPVTGEIVGTEARILGWARITQVMQDTAMAEVMDSDGEALMTTDRVITE